MCVVLLRAHVLVDPDVGQGVFCFMLFFSSLFIIVFQRCPATTSVSATVQPACCLARLMLRVRLFAYGNACCRQDTKTFLTLRRLSVSCSRRWAREWRGGAKELEAAASASGHRAHAWSGTMINLWGRFARCAGAARCIARDTPCCFSASAHQRDRSDCSKRHAMRDVYVRCSATSLRSRHPTRCSSFYCILQSLSARRDAMGKRK